MRPADNILTVNGVGDALAKKLNLLGISTVKDLTEYYPRRYDDYSRLSAIAESKPGLVSIKARIVQASGRYVRRGMHITEAIASDPSGSMRLIWFNQPYRPGSIKKDQEYYVSGNFELSRGHFSLMNPSMELVRDFPVNTARIVPVYRETKGLKSNTIRKIIADIRPYIETLPESLPAGVLAENRLYGRAKAILSMHFPDSGADLEKARRRLGFEEIYGLTLASLLNKYEASKYKTHVIPFDGQLAQRFVSSLPFKLTESQRKTSWRIYKDMQLDVPMNRLLEGDVGAGKTVVAAMASLMALKHGYQVAFMAPTALLARQHADNLHKMLVPLKMENEVALLTGGLKQKSKTDLHGVIRGKNAHLIVGTHALFSEGVKFNKLGLIIIDEQHRFGVEQRKKLQKKAGGRMPHILSMTATPIPRTLALTLYGELDISVLKEKPKDRLPVVTEIVSPNSRKALYARIDKELDVGRQMFVVCPLIQDSDSVQSLSAESVYRDLSAKIFKHRKVTLLHGKMSAEDKDKVMEDFLQRKSDILVSTTVIEVGVDVPNATIMIVEGAERFGLAQLHQLRGRIGRGASQGYCYLMMSDSKEPTRRLQAVVSSADGFKLSELDLQLRGPGAIYGQMQSGALDLRVARLDDLQLIEAARGASRNFIDSGKQLPDYPELEDNVRQYRAVTNLN